MTKKQSLRELLPGNDSFNAWRGIVSSIIIWACVLSCTAQAFCNGMVSMKAYPAIGNYRMYKQTVPICVELTNLGPPLRGTLEVTNAVSYQRKKEVILRKVDLPQFTPKHYFLYFPEIETYYPDITIELKSGRKTIAETKVKTDQIYPKDFLILAFSKEQSGLEYLTSQKLKPILGKDAQIYLTYPAIPRLPPSWIGYKSADLIVLCNYASLSFSREQEKAIRDWVLAGGTLFVSSGLSPSEFSQSALKDILPVRPSLAPEATMNDTVEITSMPELEAFCNNSLINLQAPILMSRVESKNGTVLVSENQHPLLVKKNYARGAVYYFACDITKPPFNAWQGNTDLWSRIYTDIAASKRVTLSTADNALHSNMPQVSPPSMKKLSLFLFLYILIVGPLNYYILRRKDRMLLSFITVPVIAILFTISSFYYGYFTKGSKVLFQVLSFCEIKRDIPDAPVTSYFSLFSPRLARYTIEINRPDAIAWENNPIENKDFYLEWQERGGLLLSDLEFDMWSMRSFKLEEIYHFPGTIEYQLSYSSGTINGEINNNLDLQLKNCLIICQHRVSPLFNIRKGRQAQSLQLSDPLMNQFEMSRHLAKLYHFDFNDKDIDRRRENLSTIRNITSSYFSRKDFDSPVIYGWSDKNISEIKLQKYHCKLQNTTFLMIE